MNVLNDSAQSTLFWSGNAVERERETERGRETETHSQREREKGRRKQMDRKKSEVKKNNLTQVDLIQKFVDILFMI